LVVGIEIAHVFQLLCVLLLLSSSLEGSLSLLVGMLFKQRFDLCVVVLCNLIALVVEGFLDVAEFSSVSRSHVTELGLHVPNQIVNVVVHLRHCFDIVGVLLLEVIVELFDQLLLVLDDLLALVLLNFYFLNRQVRVRHLLSRLHTASIWWQFE